MCYVHNPVFSNTEHKNLSCVYGVERNLSQTEKFGNTWLAKTIGLVLMGPQLLDTGLWLSGRVFDLRLRGSLV